MPTLTKEQEEKQREENVVKLLKQMEDHLGPAGTFAKTVERLRGLEDMVGPLKDLDVAGIHTRMEKLHASQESLTRTIRNSKNGLYVSGIEDVKDFSILRAMLGRKYGDASKKWGNVGAEQEFEIIQAASAKLRETFAKANITMGDDVSAGSFIPDQVIPDVIGAIYTRSVFVSLEGEGQTRVSVIDGLMGGNVKIHKFEGGLVAAWIGEEDPYPASTVKTGTVTLNPHKLGVFVGITEEMRKFGGFGFEGLLSRDMVRAAAKKLDWTIAYGFSGDNAPRGIAKTKGIKLFSAQSGKFETYDPSTTNLANTTNYQADWQGGEFGYDGIDNAILALEEDDVVVDESFALVSAPRYFKRLKQLKAQQFSGQIAAGGANIPYLLGAPMIPDSRLADIIGAFDKSTQIKKGLAGASVGAPTTLTSPTGDRFTDVFLGNFSDVVFGRWAGVEISDDEGKGAGFSTDVVNMKLRLLGDVTNRQPRTLVLVPDAQIIT